MTKSNITGKDKEFYALGKKMFDRIPPLRPVAPKSLETAFRTADDVRISIDEWDDGGAWLHLQGRSASMHTTLTRDEAVQLLAGLEAILNR